MYKGVESVLEFHFTRKKTIGWKDLNYSMLKSDPVTEYGYCEATSLGVGGTSRCFGGSFREATSLGVGRECRP